VIRPEVAGGVIAGDKMAKVVQNMRLASVRKQMPIIADELQKWQRAQAAAQKVPNNEVYQRLALGAAASLQRALTPLGINLQDVMQQGPGAAQAEQQNNQQPKVQYKTGGAVRQQRAAGGAVARPQGDKVSQAAVHYRFPGEPNRVCMMCRMMIWPDRCTAVAGKIKPGGLCDLFERKKHQAQFSPEKIGAKRARNGHWYVPDRDRPGRYLIVLPKKAGAIGRGA
jgi:hypothetical protein